jgi:hypothetical protein
MPRHTPGNYVPLDVNYARDRAIRMAGPDAELLYIRSLAYAKGAQSNGMVPDFDLEVVSIGLRNVKKSVAALVNVGLWTQQEDGWFISSWWKWNNSVQAEDAFVENQSDKGKQGNHQRWHVGRNVTDPDCIWCHRSDRNSDGGSDSSGDRTPESPIREGKENKGNGDRAKALETEFETWYFTYPKKVGRPAALTKYKAARKKTTADVLLSGARVMAAAYQGDKTYCPNPATWLHQERWNDEPTAPVEEPKQWFER